MIRTVLRSRPARALGACLAVVALTATACGAGGGSGSSGGNVYKIGALLDLTGSYSALGTSEQKAVKLFVNQVNAKGGINGHKLKLVVADTTSSESTAVNKLRKLATQDDVVAVIGPSSSGESVAVKPISLSLRVPVMTLASSKDIVTPPDQAKYIFKEFPSSDSSLRAQLQYIKDQGKKTVAILASNNGYGQEPVKLLPKLVKQYGLKLVGSETFPPDATNMTAQLSALAGKHPDALLVWAVNPANAIIAKNAKAINFPGTIFNSPGAASPDYISVGGSAVNGTLVQGSKIAVPGSLKPSDPQAKVIKNFVSTWKDKFGKAPNQYAANGWDGMELLATALRKGNVEPSNTDKARDALRDSLENNVKNQALINAVYSFSSKNHGPTGIKGLAVLVVKNGKFDLKKSY